MVLEDAAEPQATLFREIRRGHDHGRSPGDEVGAHRLRDGAWTGAGQQNGLVLKCRRFVRSRNVDPGVGDGRRDAIIAQPMPQTLESTFTVNGLRLGSQSMNVTTGPCPTGRQRDVFLGIEPRGNQFGDVVTELPGDRRSITVGG